MKIDTAKIQVGDCFRATTRWLFNGDKWPEDIITIITSSSAASADRSTSMPVGWAHEIRGVIHDQDTDFNDGSAFRSWEAYFSKRRQTKRISAYWASRNLVEKL